MAEEYEDLTLERGAVEVVVGDLDSAVGSVESLGESVEVDALPSLQHLLLAAGQALEVVGLGVPRIAVKGLDLGQGG